MIFFKKQKVVLDKIQAYLDEVELCGNRFQDCMHALLARLDDPDNEGRADLVHQAESKADDLRRQIEFELYDRALIPESRGDVLGLLETLDIIPGAFQSLCEQVLLQRIVWPEDLKARYLKLIDVNLKSTRLVREAVTCMFAGTDVRKLAEQIDAGGKRIGSHRAGADPGHLRGHSGQGGQDPAQGNRDQHGGHLRYRRKRQGPADPGRGQAQDLMFRLLSGVLMGWSLGSNDSANIFGTAVFSKKIRYRTATILCSLFVIAGAVLQGREGVHTLGGLADQTLNSAFAASLAAALTVTLMSVLKLPVSTSQAMVGAIIGAGLMRGSLHLTGLTKVVICWVGTPIGAAVLTMILYPTLGRLLSALRLNILMQDAVLKGGLIAAGCYGAYALGANNVANVTGVYVQAGQLTELQAALLGGASIALGALTYSKNVMITVGKNLVKLDPFSAFIAVLSMSLVVHFYAWVGVPVSTSQAIVGAVVGFGLIKGAQTINARTMLRILFGWVGTPALAFALACAIFWTIRA